MHRTGSKGLVDRGSDAGLVFPRMVPAGPFAIASIGPGERGPARHIAGKNLYFRAVRHIPKS
jgi:hypothetical protein